MWNGGRQRFTIRWFGAVVVVVGGGCGGGGVVVVEEGVVAGLPRVNSRLMATLRCH